MYKRQSFISLVVSLVVSTPIQDKLYDLSKARIKLQSLITAVDEVLAETEDADEYTKKMTAMDDELYQSFLAEVDKSATTLKLKVRTIDVYKRQTQRDLERYSFKMVNGDFNKAFKCTDDKVKTHHCLVPCSDKGIQLPRDHREWDKYSSIEEIQNTDFDELDKASLTVHFIAKQRIERPSFRGKIESIIDNDLHNMLYLAPEDKDKADALKQEYDSFRNWISNVLEHKSPDKLKEKLEHLSEQFAFYDIDISDITTQLSNELAIFEEFRAYKDYKAPDKAIIEHLLWIKSVSYTHLDVYKRQLP